MKHFLLALLTFWALSFHAQAQFSFGVRAGNNFADLTLNGIEDIHGMTKYSHKTVHIGGIVQYNISSISNKLRLESGVLLSLKGSDFEYRKSNAFSEIGISSLSLNQKISLTYLEIPVNVVFSSDLGAEKFQIIAGPYLGIFVDGKAKINFFNSELDAKTKEYVKNLSIRAKTIDLGVNIGAGLEMDAILVRIQYGYGLTKIDIDNSKNRVFSISIGCMFGDGY